jgi:hypothetical protein
MGKDDLVVDVTVRHGFIGDARDVLRHGTLRNPDRPDQLLLDQAAADKIRNYREPYAPIGRWRFCLRACLPRGAFTASFCGCSTSLRTGGSQSPPGLVQVPRGMPCTFPRVACS